MSARLRPEDDARPWLPAADVSPVAVYDEWNTPRVGVVEQDGEKFLFACLLGDEDVYNVWAYAPVTPEEIARLEASEGPRFLDTVESLLANKLLVVAFADEWQLKAWQLIDSGIEGPRGITQRFVHRWKSSLAQQEDQAEQMAKSPELVDA